MLFNISLLLYLKNPQVMSRHYIAFSFYEHSADSNPTAENNS